MKNGIFGKWFREFATLVFTQTVQAFLLAIVLSIIVSCLSQASGGAAANAAGLLAIVALASFNSIERLVKNIFGVTSGFGDPGLANGRGALTATSLFARKGLGRLSDNLTKGSDAKRKIEMGQQGLNNIRAQEAKDALTADMNNPTGGGDDKKTDLKDEKEKVTEEAKDQIEEQVLKLEALKDISSLTTAIKELDTSVKQQNADKTKEKMEKYQAMIDEGKRMKSSAFRENVGAAIGGTAGAIVGMATGEKVLETTLAGAGAGDALGQFTANRKAAKEQHNKGMKKMQDDYEKTISDLEKKIGDFDTAVRKEIDSKLQAGSADVEKYAKAKLDARNDALSKLKKPDTEIPTNSDIKKRQKELSSRIDKYVDAGK